MDLIDVILWIMSLVKCRKLMMRDLQFMRFLVNFYKFSYYDYFMFEMKIKGRMDLINAMLYLWF